jgi:hypothetical protein
LKCSGMMMLPPLAGDPVTNCNAPFVMIMLSFMRNVFYAGERATWHPETEATWHQRQCVKQ